MLNCDLSFAGFTTNANALPEASLQHLVQLGFSTAIKNSIAGVKAGIIGNGATPWSDDDIMAAATQYGFARWARDEETAAAICAAIQRDMFESILSGVARKGRTSSPRMSDDEKLRRAIATEFLENLAKAKGKALPKRSKPEEKAAFEEMLAKAFANEKFSASVDKEFAARKKRTMSASDFDDLI